jgi:uncharacterized secreted protein with C-terminal beta-propeller domain
MKRKNSHRSRTSRHRNLRLESLERRFVLDGSLTIVQDIQSADELQQLLLKEATDQWEHLFGLEIQRAFGNTTIHSRLDFNRDFAALDENVIAHTDGEYLYVISGQSKLTIVDIRDPAAMKGMGSLELKGNARELYVLGDRLVVIADDSMSWDPIPMRGIYVPQWDPRQSITVYDISDRAQPEFVSRTVVDGSFIAARAEGDSIYLAIGSDIHIPQPVLTCETPVFPEARTFGPEYFQDIITFVACRYETREDYLARMSDTILEDVLPHSLTERHDQTTSRGFLVEAENIYRDDAKLGQLVSTVVIDVQAGTVDSAGVLTSSNSSSNFAHITPEHVYVAVIYQDHTHLRRSNRIHQFTIGDDVQLTASARLSSLIETPFAMDEWNGHFRVASNDSGTVSTVYALDTETLDVVGHLTIPGRWETVHFLDSQAYLLSHGRGNDDLVIDLSDPAKPVQRDNLDLSLPSSALIPVGGEYLIDVGRDRDLANGVELNPLVSLLNIQDLDSVELVDREKVGIEREDWITALAGRDSVQYFPAHLILAVAYQTRLNRPIFDTVLDDVILPGPGLLDSLDWNKIANYLPKDLDGKIERVLREISSGKSIEDIVDGLPQETRELIEKGIEGLPADLKAAAKRLLGEGEGRSANLTRPIDKSGLSVFQIDPAAENPIEILGTISHEKGIRHSFVVGDVLFAISSDTVTAHDVDDPSQQVGKYYFGRISFDDTQVVDVDRGRAVLDVLKNDRVPESAKIVRVSEPKLGGTATISEDGRSIIYIPPARNTLDAAGVINRSIKDDSFEYSVELEDGTRGQATVHVRLVREQPGDKMARLAVADLAKRLEIDPSRIEIVRVEAHRWPDGCLGIHRPDAACTLAIVPGFFVRLKALDKDYVYHTDSESRVELVEGARPDPDPGVVPDVFRVAHDSAETKLDVLANDFPGITFIKAPQITAVSETRAGGTVKIGEHGLLLLYTPPANFVGEDHFRYMVDNGPSGRVTVHVVGREDPQVPDDDQRPLIKVDLEFTDEAGAAIRRVEIGQTFYVNVFVDDLRRDGNGVFGGYVDIEFDPALAQSVGEIEFNRTYPNGKSGEVSDGLIDELGAFTDSIPTLGNERQLLVRVPLEAAAEGVLKLASNPADNRPAHEMTLFGLNLPVEPEHVLYGDAAVQIVNGYHNEDEPTDVNGDLSVTPIDVLNVINVINESGAGELRTTMKHFLSREGRSSAAHAAKMFYDVNRDRHVTSIDALGVVNRLNSDSVKLAARLRNQGNDSANDTSDNGRGLVDNGNLPNDLGQGDRNDENGTDENGRTRTTTNTPAQNDTDEYRRKLERGIPTNAANGRGEGESSADEADVVDDLCNHHHSLNSIDGFFADLGL